MCVPIVVSLAAGITPDASIVQYMGHGSG
jgi:hypothetical protein